MNYNIHKMNLYPRSFESIKMGTKTVEMRLNDEKRTKIQKGDIIVFINTKTQEELKVKVIDLVVYKDFYELYNCYDKISIGYSETEIADPKDMYEYYTKDLIAKYGALAIKIEFYFEK